MATGTTVDFDLNRTEVVTLALSALGVSEPSNTDMALGIKILNMVVRALDVRGQWPHTISNTESTLTTVTSQQAYATGATATTIKTNILRLEYAAVLINGDREPLTILDKPLSLRTTLQDDSNSQPTAIHLERGKLLSANRALLYPTPNAAYTIVYKYRRAVYDFDLSTDNPDLMPEFNLALQQMLSAKLAPHYGIPLNERQIMLAEAEKDLADTIAGTADRPSYVPLQTRYF